MTDLSTYNFVELSCRLTFARKQCWHHTNLSMPSLDSDKEHEANREANRIKAAELKDYCDRIKAELMGRINDEL